MDRLVIIKEAQAVLCEVQTEFLNKFRLVMVFKSLPWLRLLVAGLSPRRPGFGPLPTPVRAVMDRVALGHVFLPVLSISPVIIITPVLQTHLHLLVALNQKEKRAKPGNLPHKQCSVICRGSLFLKT